MEENSSSSNTEPPQILIRCTSKHFELFSDFFIFKNQISCLSLFDEVWLIQNEFFRYLKKKSNSIHFLWKWIIFYFVMFGKPNNSFFFFYFITNSGKPQLPLATLLLKSIKGLESFFFPPTEFSNKR